MQNNRLLILANEIAHARAIRDLLEPRGYRVTCFTSAKAALAAIREQAYDLILTDLVTPEMSGLEFLSAAQVEDSELAGIVMTGHSAVDTASQTAQAGAIDYIVGPFQLATALPVMVRALGVRQLRLENLHLQQAARLYELSMVIRLTLGFEAVLEKVTDAAMGHTQIAGVSVLLPMDSGKELRIAVARGENAAQNEGKRIPFSPSLRRWVDQSLVRRSRQDNFADAPAALPFCFSQLAGGASIPMLAGGRFIGVISYTLKNPRRLASPAQVKALNILADAAAAALESASLLEQLRSAERRYRSLSDSAADIIFRYELRPRPRFAYVNPAVASILGYSPEEHYADPELFLKIVHPDDRHLMETLLRGGFPTGSTVTLRGIHRTGKLVWIEQHNTLARDADGQLTAIDGIGRDITARKQLEEELRQSQKMEAIGLLASGVAHDFNSLLTVILGYSDLILDDDSPSASSVEKILQVKKAAEQASTLTRQLLAFGRKNLVRPTVLDVNTIVKSNSKMLRRIIGGGIEIVTILDDDLGYVKADGGQIEQILMNLAVNAGRAMPQGGTITIKTQNIMLDEVRATGPLTIQPGPYVMLSVSDTGCGMDAATRARVFEPFYTTKARGEGSGLGLSIVFGVVKQSAGNIMVFSEPGKGARFEILLPRIAGPDESLEAMPVSADGLIGSETILVVEDDAGVRELIGAVLQRGGYEVLSASDGSEALRLYHEHEGKIALILTDIIMYGMSGPSLVESVKFLNQGVRVLYMSGYSGDAIVSHGELDPRIPFIQKPFAMAHLMRKIREILDRGICEPNAAKGARNGIVEAAQTDS